MVKPSDSSESAERPSRGRRRLVPATEFLERGKGLSEIDAAAFRTDLDAVGDPYADDPFTR